MYNKRRTFRKIKQEDEIFGQDENFYFIVGYTSGGAPYGTTWEEAEEAGLLEEDEPIDEDDLPF